MSVHQEDREDRPKVHLPVLRSGFFLECKLRLSETYLFRNPDLSIPGFRLAPAIASLAGMTTRLFLGIRHTARTYIRDLLGWSDRECAKTERTRDVR